MSGASENPPRERTISMKYVLYPSLEKVNFHFPSARPIRTNPPFLSVSCDFAIFCRLSPLNSISMVTPSMPFPSSSTTVPRTPARVCAVAPGGKAPAQATRARAEPATMTSFMRSSCLYYTRSWPRLQRPFSASSTP
jgi:hypothetical protein